ncbi:MAG: hypothetical protein HON90_05555 [Halobacteriovoraceae bacterium]|jgi:hypothetical protein|nr:hypothetical protein [Halobacteriovoraceae bacterium]
MNKTELVEKAIWNSVKSNKDNQVIVNDDWVQVTTPKAPTPFLNGVYKCMYKGSDFNEVVAKVIESYKNQDLPFRWKTCQSSTPANIKEVLLSNGLILKDELLGLIALPNKISIAKNEQVRIERLSVLNLEDWLSVQRTAWDVPDQGIACVPSAGLRELPL